MTKTPTIGSVKISNRFFTQERNSYSNWKFAFWRELGQNSFDAKAARFDIQINKIDENETQVIFADDGRGMDEQTLLDAFLTLGETGKKGVEDVGGFGRAKLIIAYANLKYKISSHDYVCEGNGANFEITHEHKQIQGCVFEILVDASENSLRNALLEFVSLSYLPYTQIYLNGEHINKSLHRGRRVRELSFGDVYVNKSPKAKQNLLIARVNGVAMFSAYVSSNAQVILNIRPEISKDVLLSNRDSLKYYCQQEFNLFLQELAIDCVSALEDKSKRFTKYVNKGNYTTKRRKQKLAVSPAAETGEVTFWEKEQNKTERPEIAQQPYLPQNIGESENARHHEQGLCPILSGMVIVNECNSQKIVNLIKHYDPTKGKIGSTRYAFIRQWYTVIDIALEKFLEMTSQDVINFAIGLVFNDQTENTTLAQHIFSDGVHYFLINPILSTGTMRYRLNSKGDYFRLLSKATHEIAHVAYHGHDQAFSYFRDAFLEECLQDTSETFAAMKNAK